jgi:NhaA family Na+:H+ antiporter
MADEQLPDALAGLRLQREIDFERDNIRGGGSDEGVAHLVVYGDYLCPYCRGIRGVLAELRKTLGKRLVYAFRQFPDDRSHPGAQFLASAAIAAGLQDRFWPMHDWIYEQDLPIAPEQVFAFATSIGLDGERFRRDVDAEPTRARIGEDVQEGIANGVTGTPTFFVDGIRYDGAWDFHSMLEALQQPVAAQVERSARVFASLPASAGIVLLLAAVAALICANTSIAPYYRTLMDAAFSIGPPGKAVSMTVGEWFSEGLLAFFFLLVGLEIRREVTVGALTNPRAALLPVLAAIGGVIVPAGVYLAINTHATAPGWSVPTATDVAFTLGILALLGERIPVALRVFIAALAVVDDILSMLTLAIFYPHAFEIDGLFAGAAAVAALFALNRARVYIGWPYAIVAAALWISLHVAGIHAALAGVILAAFLPTRPAPNVAPLLAQAATALDALQRTEDDIVGGTGRSHAQEERVWEWAARNLSAASARLLSPAERVERAIAPWSAYVVLPLFAFSATGISLAVDLHSADATRVLAGVVLGLVVGKPLGVLVVSGLAVVSRVALAPKGVSLCTFVGAACLCGIGDTVALLMADQAFPHGGDAAVAKMGVLVGSACAATLGIIVLTICCARSPSPKA